MRYLSWLTLTLVTGCYFHMPVIVDNDTSQAVLIDIHGRDFPTPVQLERREPGEYMGSRHCWKKNDSILLATDQHPHPIALDPKDFCDSLCKCDIPVSKLLKQMTPGFVLKRQQETCTGGGPILQPDVRKQLCEAYAARPASNVLSSFPDPAMLPQ